MSIFHCKSLYLLPQDFGLGNKVGMNHISEIQSYYLLLQIFCLIFSSKFNQLHKQDFKKAKKISNYYLNVFCLVFWFSVWKWNFMVINWLKRYNGNYGKNPLESLGVNKSLLNVYFWSRTIRINGITQGNSIEYVLELRILSDFFLEGGSKSSLQYRHFHIWHLFHNKGVGKVWIPVLNLLFTDHLTSRM